MTRRSREVGIIKSCILGAALVAGFAATAYAGDNKLELSGSASFTTDYMFRSISNTNDDPAAQPEFDATYGMFFAGIWGSNTVYGKGIEIDYYGGIAPVWNDITFNVTALEYTYPGADSTADYFELKSGAAWAKGAWSVGFNNYWSPDFAQAFGQSDAIEGSLGYSFSGKIFNFFSPSVSGTVGFQSFDKVASDYTYWNAGLTLGFLDHWSADIRYYDTDYSETECFVEQGFDKHACDARAVGTIKATF
jgi:uncharacterized protein (TIGR02001 family)